MQKKSKSSGHRYISDGITLSDKKGWNKVENCQKMKNSINIPELSSKVATKVDHFTARGTSRIFYCFLLMKLTQFEKTG